MKPYMNVLRLCEKNYETIYECAKVMRGFLNYIFHNFTSVDILESTIIVVSLLILNLKSYN